MDISSFQNRFTRQLEPVYGRQEAVSLFKLVSEQVLGLKAHEITMARNREIPETELNELESILGRLQDHEPVQYILEKAWFNGMWLRVNTHTLIPRQETEELVQWIVEDGLNTGMQILDIGTGSGCIAIALNKHVPGTAVWAIDKSTGALAVADENAQEQGVKVHFSQADILELEDLSDLPERAGASAFDLVVSNPPYVRNLEKKEIRKNVLDYEPAGALFVPDEDPLIFYRKIAGLAFDNLLPGGRLYFEINQYLGKETHDLVLGAGFSEVTLRKDLFGNYRMLKAIK